MFTFKFNGTSSEDMGVIVEKRPSIQSSQIRFGIVHIRGRDGAITFNSGKEQMNVEFPVLIQGMDNLLKVKGWLQGKGEWERSDLPERTQSIQFVEEQIAELVVDLGLDIYRMVVKFAVLDPEWFENGGFKPVPKEGSVLTFNNKGNYKSRPIFRLTRETDKSNVFIKADTFALEYTYPFGEYEVDIDMDRKSASFRGQGRDRFLSITPDKPFIPSGTSTATITPATVQVEVHKLSTWN